MTQELDKNREILTFFAVGLMRQDAAISQERAAPVTELNPALHMGWEKLSFQCYVEDITPPLTLADLVSWLHKPLADWGMIFPTDWADKSLLKDGVPTEFCEELGADMETVRDLRLEMQDAIFRELHTFCRKLGDASLYSAMRAFLIQNPIIDDLLTAIEHNRRWVSEMRPKLRDCFEPIPEACIRRKAGGKEEYIARCPHCGWTLAWAGERPFCHRSGVCESLYGETLEGFTWHKYDPAMFRTKEGIQRYVVAPEVSLLSLRDELIKLNGVSCELFPDFDAYDMLITLPSGEKWAVDMKDHHDPVRLARSLKPFSPVPKWDKAFIVFPQHRASRDYLNRFINHWQRAHNEDVCFVDELLSEVRKLVR